MLPELMYDKICKQIDSKCGAQLKLILFFIGCGESFRIPLKTIIDRIGLSKDSYYHARDGLE